MAVLVLLEVKVKPESINDMKSLLKEVLPDTRAHDGCQGVTVYGNLDDSNNLVLVEHWDSRDHYGKYLAWRTERGDLERLVSMLAEEPSIRYFERVDV